MSITTTTPHAVWDRIRAALASGMPAGWSEATSTPYALSYDARAKAARSWAVSMPQTAFTDPRRRTKTIMDANRGTMTTTTAVVRLLLRNQQDAQRDSMAEALDAEVSCIEALAAWNASGIGTMVLSAINRSMVGDDTAFMVEITVDIRHSYTTEATP